MRLETLNMIHKLLIQEQQRAAEDLKTARTAFEESNGPGTRERLKKAEAIGEYHQTVREALADFEQQDWLGRNKYY